VRCGLGSARVSRAGERVLAIANFSLDHIFPQGSRARKRLFRRDAETSTRDACATRNPRAEPVVINSQAAAGSSIGSIGASSTYGFAIPSKCARILRSSEATNASTNEKRRSSHAKDLLLIS